MSNIKKGRILFSFWINKTQSKQIQDAIEDDDVETACNIFAQSFKKGLVEKR